MNRSPAAFKRKTLALRKYLGIRETKGMSLAIMD